MKLIHIFLFSQKKGKISLTPLAKKKNYVKKFTCYFHPTLKKVNHLFLDYET